MPDLASNGRSLAMGLWTALALSTVLVASRRFTGAYTGPLPVAVLIAAVTLAVAISLTALGLLRITRPRPSKLTWSEALPELTAWMVPTLFTLTMAAGATAGQLGSLLGIAIVAACVLVVAVAQPERWFSSISEPPHVADDVRFANADPAKHPFAATHSGWDDGFAPADDETATQWMVRRHNCDGESVEGTIRVDFTVGQREATVHVTFCPPLAGQPAVEVEDVEGNDWRLKAEAAFPYGLRLQVQRGRDVSAPATGRIAYHATTSRALRAA